MTTLGVMYTFQFSLMTFTACHTLPRLISALCVPDEVFVPTCHKVPVKTLVRACNAVLFVISELSICSSCNSATAMCSAVICW